MEMLDIYVGKKAQNVIEDNGFSQQLISVFLGASGGPKWFTLLGLDKYLFGDFFRPRQEPLHLIGSSAGAFRSACFAQRNPVNAISTLAKQYSESDFSQDDSPQALTARAEQMLEHIFNQDGINNIIKNPIMKPHFITALSRFCVGSENKFCQTLGLTQSYLLNKVSRKLLNWQYERVVFRPADSILTINDPHQINSHYVNFNVDNVKTSLLASGSIPLIMKGVANINGAPLGMYRDGGIIDYHFDISFNKSGLVLYPHFSSIPKAGWFDKTSSRNASANNYDQTIMLVPSPDFVEQLPYGKIPDRNDFKQLDKTSRLKYWQKVFSESERLADDFHQFVDKQDLSKLKPLPF